MERPRTNSYESSEEESEMDTQTVKDQSQVFEEMRDLLKSQQASLKQNLQLLQAKTTKLSKTGQAEKSISRSSEDKSSKRGSDLKQASVSEVEGLEDSVGSNSKQRSYSSVAKSRDAIQICPICAAEFDEPDNPDALEEHVAGHWCSSESQ